MAPLLLALPAYGYSDRGPGSDDGGGIFDFLLNSILTVFVLGFAAFIVKYAYDAYKIVESQSGHRSFFYPRGGVRGRQEKAGQILEGSCSAVSKPNFANTYL